MKKTIPIGITNYAEFINDNFYFVDKTLLIQEFLERKAKVTLVTRPRRFGKTINMSMLAEFFDITKDSHKLFVGTKIMDTPYASEMNQYPVIYMTFANAKGNKENIVKFIKEQLQLEYMRYMHILENLNEFNQKTYDKIKQGIINYDNGTLNDVNNAISFLMRILKEYYHKDVMVFIDEYDTPFMEAHVNGFYDEVKEDLSALLRTSLKNSPCLKYSFLTGIQRIAKENIFSDLNNLKVCTVANDGYAPYFGFTTEETKEILEYYGLELTDEVKDMYDGYKIGNQDIYNPWSIMNYADNQILDSYWANTSAVKMIKNALLHIDRTNQYFDELYDELIMTGKVTTKVSLNTSFYEDATAATLWGYFVNAGYLTVDSVLSLDDDVYCIRIPNKEVRKEIMKITEAYLSLEEGQSNELLDALIHEDKEKFINRYRTILQIPSYHDLNNENSYHMMVLGAFSHLLNRYEIKSNKEVGLGRCDIILKAKNPTHTSFVLEFKYLKEKASNVQEKLEQLSTQAIQQIIDKKYDEGLIGKVVYIGLSHYKKDVNMKWIYKN